MPRNLNARQNLWNGVDIPAEVMSTEYMEAGCSGIILCQVPDDVEIQDSDILRNLSGDELDTGLKEYRRNG